VGFPADEKWSKYLDFRPKLHFLAYPYVLPITHRLLTVYQFVIRFAAAGFLKNAKE